MNSNNLKRPIFLFALFIGILCWTSLTAAAKTDLRLEISDVQWSGGSSSGYNVFSESDSIQTVYFTVRNREDPTPFFVTFSTGQASNFNRRLEEEGVTMEYQIYDSESRNAILKDLPTATSAEVIAGSFSAGEEEKQMSFCVVIPARQIVPDENYRDNITVSVYSGTLSNYKKEDSESVRISVRVMETAELCLVESGESFNVNSSRKDVNFGVLESGKTSQFDLRVRSNAGYEVTFESEYGGELKKSNSDDENTIPYELRIDNTVADLRRKKSHIERRNRVTDSNGDAYSILIRIGNLGSATAGTYRDNITVTVAPY